MSFSFPSAVNAEFTTDSNAWTNIQANLVSPGDTVIVRYGAMARREDTGDCAFWEKRALFRRDETDPVAVVGSVVDLATPIKTLGANLWDIRVRLEADDYIYFDVKGGSGVNIGWVLFGEATSLDYPT